MKPLADILFAHTHTRGADMFRVVGLQEQAPTANLEATQSVLANRIALIEKQLVDMALARGRYIQKINDEREAVQHELARLLGLQISTNTETGSFPGVVDWVAWLYRLSTTRFDLPADFDDALQFLNGAGDQAFIDLRIEARVFINANSTQAVTFASTSRQLIQRLTTIRDTAAEGSDVQTQAQQFIDRMLPFVNTTRIVAVNKAREFLAMRGTRALAMSKNQIIEALRAINDPDRAAAEEIIRDLQDENFELGRKVGEFGLTFAGQVFEFLTALRSLRATGLLTPDLDAQLINNELSPEDLLTLRNNLINTVILFESAFGMLELDTLYSAISSLSALDAADPAQIALDGPTNLAQARRVIATALDSAKKILGIWEISLQDAPSAVPSRGNIAEWVDAKGTYANPDAVSKARQLDKRIEEVRASLVVLDAGFPPVDNSVSEALESARNGLVQQRNANAERLQEIRDSHRVIRVFKCQKGDKIEIPFEIRGGTAPYTVSLDVTPFNAKAERVTRQLLFEAYDFATAGGKVRIDQGLVTGFRADNFGDLAVFAEENPDAAAAIEHMTSSRNYIEVESSVGQRVRVISNRVTRVLQNAGFYKIVFDKIGSHQTGTFALTFTDVDGASDTQYIKVLVNEQKTCARTGAPFARLLNEFGDARWTSVTTDAEAEVMVRRRAAKLAYQGTVVHAGNNDQEIDDLTTRIRNLKNELGQYHIQEALRQGDTSNPDYRRGFVLEKEIENLKAHRARLGPKTKIADPLVLPEKPKPLKSVWVGRHSTDPLPTPPNPSRPRRRASDSVTSEFAYEVFAPNYQHVYSTEELTFMQAAQYVGLGGHPDEFNWARGKPRPPATPATTIGVNARTYYAEDLPIDLQDAQYRSYVSRSMLKADLDSEPLQPMALPTIGARFGFVSDTESSEDDEEPVVAVQTMRVALHATGFETDSEDDEEELISTALAPVFDDDVVALVDKGKDEEESPFDAKFATSSGSDTDDEIDMRIQEAAASTKSLRSRWAEITGKELPTLDPRRANVDDVRSFVASLSAHSNDARKNSMELIRDVNNTLGELSALSTELS